MAPPVEGGRYDNGGGSRARPNHIRISSGAPIGAQACSPFKPFKQPSAIFAGSGGVPQMSKGSVSSLATAFNGSQVSWHAGAQAVAHARISRSGCYVHPSLSCCDLQTRLSAAFVCLQMHTTPHTEYRAPQAPQSGNPFNTCAMTLAATKYEHDFLFRSPSDR